MNALNKMRTRMRPLALLMVIGMGFSACVGNSIQRDAAPHAGERSLDKWMDDALIPYLLQQLAQHPRFKGQPVLIVRMQGDNVQARIDDLTDRIRERIIDALLKKPGLCVSWRPASGPWQHHQSLEEVACDGNYKINYYIGIDTGLTRVSGNLSVKVRALNLAEQKWVSGFGRTWEGKPTQAQLAAMGREHPDEYLRGLRPLPFSDRQPDLLAAYLARNLSCLLRQGEAGDLVVHVSAPSPDTPAVLKTTMDLVGKYLARFREVTVTDDMDQANVALITELHRIHRNFYQVWVSARRRPEATYLPGAETEAYVQMDGDNATVAAGEWSARPPDSTVPAGGRSKPSKLISSFDLLTPLRREFCNTETPWRSGVRRVEPFGRISTGSCLAVELSLATPTYLFMVGQDAAGELTHLFPSACSGWEPDHGRIHPGRLFQFPSLSDPKAGRLELNGLPGMERVYAIAITAPEVAEQLTDRLKDTRGPCRPDTAFSDPPSADDGRRADERIQHWQSYLNRLEADNPGAVQWHAIPFWHMPK